jgi:hypothetical protein
MYIEDLKTLREFLRFQLSSGEGILDRFEQTGQAVRIRKRLSAFDPSPDRQFIYIEGRRKNKALLIAHSDTWWDESNGLGMGIEEGIGADGRAGCAILWLLKDSGHSLLVLNGSASGDLTASRFLRDENKYLFEKINRDHNFALDFSLPGKANIRTFGQGKNDLGKFISDRTDFTVSGTEEKSDLCVICKDICGANISTGYYNERTGNEKIDDQAWLDTLNAARILLNRETDIRFSLE